MGFAGFMGVMALVLPVASRPARAEAPSASAVKAFNQYAAKVEAALAQQHRSASTFIAGLESNAQTNENAKMDAKLRRGEPVIERLTPRDADLPGALLHDWRGTAFVAGARAADFERLMKNFNEYPEHFAPQVVRAKILTPYSGAIPDQFTASMRVRQKHVITVVMDTTYDVSVEHLDARHGYSISRSTRIDEISSPGTAKERVLTSAEEHGFLWRLNTYWTFEERDDGLYMQVETISLTRSIPTGLGWLIRPYIESVPRESLEFTLRAACRALSDAQQKRGK